MTAIPPGRTHRITIVVRGPKDERKVKSYMKKIKAAVGRSSRITQKPAPRKRRSG